MEVIFTSTPEAIGSIDYTYQTTPFGEMLVAWHGDALCFATFTTYFLIPIGQKRIRPTLVSMYSYVQPIVAILISIGTGMEMLTWQKILAAIMVFGGVIIVSYSKSRTK